jgi:hypothetical protein
MKRRFTRRELAAIAAAGAVAARAQTSAQPGGEDLEKAARDLNAHNSETLTKFEIPISTEPAFQFKA